MASRVLTMEGLTYIVANYNNGRCFPELLRSLEAQTDPGWRAIVIDDGSTDDSVAIIHAALARSAARGQVRFVARAENQGYIATTRELLRLAETDIVAVLDADDALEPGMTAALRAAYAADPRVGFVMTDFSEWNEDFTRELGHDFRLPAPPLTLLEAGNTSVSRSYRRRLYAETAGLDDDMRYNEDLDLSLKLEERCRITVLPQRLYRYRRQPGSQSRSPAFEPARAASRWRAVQAAMQRRHAGWLDRVCLWAIFSTHPLRPICRDVLTPLDRWRIARARRRRGWRNTTWLDD